MSHAQVGAAPVPPQVLRRGGAGSRTHGALGCLLLRGMPPPPTALVHRRRLHTLLDGAGRHHLVVVSAPAGTGKTELLAAWARAGAGGRETGWVTLAPGDERFWVPLAEGLRDAGVVVRPGWGEGSEGLVGERHLGELAGAVRRAPRPVVVVVDDAVPVPRRTAAQLDLLLRHCSGRLVVLMAGRHALTVAPRSRLEDTVLEIGAADLAWTDDEARLLLAARGLRLTEDEVEDVNARVGGWAAGLVMVARALEGERGEAGPWERRTGLVGGAAQLLRHATEMDEYVLSEVLDAQSPQVRHFLLATSALETLCPDSVERLLGPGARRTLHEVVHGNALVQPVPGHPHCYRYPAFFRRILVAQHAYEAAPVLRAVGDTATPPEQATARAEGPVLVENLTPRELEVLLHLDELLTTEEMAATMFVSVNTVRTHVRSVLRKLGVDRRNAAVRLGREIGLIPSRRV